MSAFRDPFFVSIIFILERKTVQDGIEMYARIASGPLKVEIDKKNLMEVR